MSNTPPGFTAAEWAAVEKHLEDTYEEDGSKKKQPRNDGRSAHAHLPHPTQPIYLDDKGVGRFKPNRIVRTLLDTGKLDLNDLGCMEFSREDREQFAQLIGYSVTGFGELSYTSDEVYEESQEAVAELMEKAADQEKE